ncbi:MAG: M28 family metallopeptidase, partial [Clostridia bacterium]
LSSSSLRGRLPGTEGNLYATEYLQSKYDSLNLISPMSLDNYLQPFSQKTLHHGDVPILHTLDNKGDVIGDYKYLTDFIIRTNWLGTSISGEVEGEIVLISKKEDFYKKNLNRKVLLIKNNLVDEFKNTSPREADGLIRYVLSLSKNIKAVIIQNDIRRNGYFHISTALTSQIRQLGYNKALSSKIVSTSNTGPMILYCSDFAFETLYTASKRENSVKIKANKELIDVESANVIGVIEGSNESNEYIVIGAHFDHLGGYDNGPFYPGALDNASGVAAMLEIARIMGEMPKPEKTIVFSAFNGEEVYLAGSQFYTQRPIFPLASTTMINLDIVGTKGSEKLDISGYYRQANYTQQLLRRYSSYLDIDSRISRIASSDHVHFAASGAQSVMLTNLEESPITHTIQDSYTKSIDLEILKEVIRLVVYYLLNQAY